MRVRYTPEARANLEDIFTYLDERSPAAARSVKEGIVRAIQRLADYPLVAPETDEPGVRELIIVRYPYKVYYQVEQEEVRIVHIRHAARRPWPDRP